MTVERKELMGRFQKWLNTNPSRNILAAECATIAEKFFKEKENLINSNKSKSILEEVINNNEEVLTADGFDNAIIGITDDLNEIKLIYSVSKCLNILELEMSNEDAFEYFTFNVSGSYMGDKTPIWCWDIL